MSVGSTPQDHYQSQEAPQAPSGPTPVAEEFDTSILERLSLPSDVQQYLSESPLTGNGDILRYGDWVLEECKQDAQAGELYREIIAPLAADLVALPELKRLDEVLQMSAAYTVHGHFISHTRLLHSSDVMRGAVAVAVQNDLDEYWSTVLGVAGLLHDIGHVAFSHSGERALMSLSERERDKLGLSGTFCHEEYGHSLIRNGAVADTLRMHSVDPEDVIAVLKESHPLHPIVDHADRGSYLIRDFSMTDISNRTKLAAAQDVRNAHADIGVEQIVRGDEVVQRAYFKDTTHAQIMLVHRAVLFSEYSTHTATLLANSVIEQEVTKLLNSGEFSLKDFLKLGDTEALEQFRPEARRWLTRRGEDQQVSGIEEHFDELVSVRFNELSPDGRVRAFDPQLANKFYDYLNRNGIDPENIFLVSSFLPDKTVTLPLAGDQRSNALTEIIDDSERFVAVFAPKDELYQPDMQKLKALTEKFLNDNTPLIAGSIEISDESSARSLAPRRIARYQTAH